MSETGIEPSCVGIGQKLISVDQKSPTTMLRILGVVFIIPNTVYMDIYSNKCSNDHSTKD